MEVFWRWKISLLVKRECKYVLGRYMSMCEGVEIESMLKNWKKINSIWIFGGRVERWGWGGR